MPLTNDPLTISGTVGKDGNPIAQNVKAYSLTNPEFSGSDVSDATYGNYHITVPASGDYYVFSSEDIGTRYEASAVVNPVDGVIRLRPTVANGFTYECTNSTAPLTMPAVEPEWPKTIGATVLVNEITFTCIARPEIEILGPIFVAPATAA